MNLACVCFARFPREDYYIYMDKAFVSGLETYLEYTSEPENNQAV